MRGHVALHQAVAVRGGLGGHLAGDHPAPAGLVLDHDGLAEHAAPAVRHGAADQVRAAAGRDRHHVAQRLVGKRVLRLGKAGHGEQHRASLEQAAAGGIHVSSTCMAPQEASRVLFFRDGADGRRGRLWAERIMDARRPSVNCKFPLN
ncbi:hypothetical protein D3C87_1622960 [compost metagenome]